MEEEARPRRGRPPRVTGTAQQEQGFEPAAEIDVAWGALQDAVTAHAAVAQANDTHWIHMGLQVVRKRAVGFLKAIEAALELVEE